MAQTKNPALIKAEELLGGAIEADLFKRVCDILWLSKIHRKPFDDLAINMLTRFSINTGCVIEKDTNYVERVWIYKYNLETKEVDKSCYYDCFLQQFVVIK